MWSCFRPCSRTRAPEGGVPPEKVALADAAWTRADVQPRSRAFPPLNPRVWKALESLWLSQHLSGSCRVPGALTRARKG